MPTVNSKQTRSNDAFPCTMTNSSVDHGWGGLHGPMHAHAKAIFCNHEQSPSLFYSIVLLLLPRRWQVGGRARSQLLLLLLLPTLLLLLPILMIVMLLILHNFLDFFLLLLLA